MFKQIYAIVTSLYFLSEPLLATYGQEGLDPYLHVNSGARAAKVLRKKNKVGLLKLKMLAQVELGQISKATFKEGLLNSCLENSKSLSLDINKPIQIGRSASQSGELLFRDEWLMHELLFELFQKDFIQVEAGLSSVEDWKMHAVILPVVLIYIYLEIQGNIDDLSDECRFIYDSNTSNLTNLSKKNLLIGRDMRVLKDSKLCAEIPCLSSPPDDWPFSGEEGDLASHVRTFAQDLLIERASREEHVEQIRGFLNKMNEDCSFPREKEDVERAISRLANVCVLSDLIRKGEGSFIQIYEKAWGVVNRDTLLHEIEHVCPLLGDFEEVVREVFGFQNRSRNLDLLLWFSPSLTRSFNSPLTEGLYINLQRILGRIAS